jgi:hypothetical protein
MTQTQFVHFGGSFWGKTTDFWRKSVKLLSVNSSLLNHHQPLFAPKGNFKATVFWKLMKNITKWAMFALWPLGHYGDILGQNHKILLNNRQYWEKCIIILFSPVCFENPIESYDNCHKLSFFLMSQTQFLCYIGHFGAKTTDCLTKI